MKVSTVLNAIGTNYHVLSRVTSEKEKARLNEIYRPLEGTLAKDKQESRLLMVMGIFQLKVEFQVSVPGRVQSVSSLSGNCGASVCQPSLKRDYI